MLLSQLKANPEQFQLRDTPWSESTVSSIVAEGIDLAKFEPLPVFAASKRGDCDYIIAGDGHSRFEAIVRLAAAGRLPSTWAIEPEDHGSDYNVPCKVVTRDQAQILSWTANLSRADFTPAEEAKVFQAMLDSGMDVSKVAKSTHKSVEYVQRALPLNTLCRDIRLQIGRPIDGGGVDKWTACAMAERFARYGIDQQQQQQLWHQALKMTFLTPKFVRDFIDRIGVSVSAKSSQDLLFSLPANAEKVISDLKDSARDARRAQWGVSYLMNVKEKGVLDDFPELKSLLDRAGDSIMAAMKSRAMADAETIGQLFQ